MQSALITTTVVYDLWDAPVTLIVGWVTPDGRVERHVENVEGLGDAEVEDMIRSARDAYRRHGQPVAP